MYTFGDPVSLENMLEIPCVLWLSVQLITSVKIYASPKEVWLNEVIEKHLKCF